MKGLTIHFSTIKSNFIVFLFIMASISFLLLLFSLNNQVVQSYSNNDVKTIKVKLIQDQNKYKHLIGIVQNIGNNSVNHIIISASFIDVSNKSIGNFSTQTDITTLNPKEMTPFDILIFDKKIYDKIKEYIININFNFTNYKDKKLAIVSDKSHLDINGFYFIDGKIQNTGNTYSNNTRVTSIIYNKNNELLGIWKAQTEPYAIPPSTIASFSIPITDKIQNFQITNYTLFTESDKFTKID